MACNCNEQGKVINIGMGCCVPVVANADAYYTKSEIDEKLDDIVISGGGITSGEVQSMIDESISGYVTTSELTQYIQNLQDQITQLQIEVSGCCGGGSGETQTRWITMTGDNDYSCSGTTKYTKEKEQTSTDGVNWVDTGNYRQGSTVIEENSADCGYVEQYKFKGNLLDMTIIEIPCTSGNTELTKSETLYNNYISADIGYCVTSIGDALSGNTALTSVTMLDSVTSIGSSAFRNCSSLPSIEIPSGVTSIGDFAFINCRSLSSITIPDSVTNIGVNVFTNCTSLTSCTIGSGVTSIGNAAFSDCSNLRSIIIPSGVTSIGERAFNGHNSFERTIMCLATTPPTLGVNAFLDYYGATSKIYVPSQSYEAYKTANEWKFYYEVGWLLPL